MMISGFLLFCMLLSGLCCTFGPAIAALYMYRKKPECGVSFFWGAFLYALFILMLERTCHQLISFTSLSQTLWFTVLYSALSTVLFEEGARWTAFGALMKRRRTPADALQFGLGFGWAGSFILVGAEMLMSAALGLALNRDPEAFAGEANTDYYVSFGEMLNESSAVDLLAVGLETLLTVVMGCALSLLVMTAVAHHQPAWLAAAAGIHLVASALGVLLAELTGSPLLTALLRLVFCVLTVFIARKALGVWKEDTDCGSGIQNWNERLPHRSI